MSKVNRGTAEEYIISVLRHTDTIQNIQDQLYRQLKCGKNVDINVYDKTGLLNSSQNLLDLNLQTLKFDVTGGRCSGLRSASIFSDKILGLAALAIVALTGVHRFLQYPKGNQARSGVAYQRERLGKSQ